MTRRAILLAILVILIAVGGVAAALPPEIPRYVIGAGGGLSEAGAFRLYATVGQGVVGPTSGGATDLCAGFWCGLARYNVYLPIVLH